MRAGQNRRYLSSLIRSGGNLRLIPQSWPCSRSPEPGTFLLPACSLVVSEEQTCSAFGWDGEKSVPERGIKILFLLRAFIWVIGHMGYIQVLYLYRV